MHTMSVGVTEASTFFEYIETWVFIIIPVDIHSDMHLAVPISKL